MLSRKLISKNDKTQLFIVFACIKSLQCIKYLPTKGQFIRVSKPISYFKI